MFKILVKKMEAVSKYWVGLLERKRSQQQKETSQTEEQHIAAAASEKMK